MAWHQRNNEHLSVDHQVFDFDPSPEAVHSRRLYNCSRWVARRISEGTEWRIRFLETNASHDEDELEELIASRIDATIAMYAGVGGNLHLEGREPWWMGHEAGFPLATICSDRIRKVVARILAGWFPGLVHSCHEIADHAVTEILAKRHLEWRHHGAAAYAKNEALYQRCFTLNDVEGFLIHESKQVAGRLAIELINDRDRDQEYWLDRHVVMDGDVCAKTDRRLFPPGMLDCDAVREAKKKLLEHMVPGRSKATSFIAKRLIEGWTVEDLEKCGKLESLIRREEKRGRKPANINRSIRMRVDKALKMINANAKRLGLQALTPEIE
jgi:hypothetical protein